MLFMPLPSPIRKFPFRITLSLFTGTNLVLCGDSFPIFFTIGKITGPVQ